MGEVPAGRRQSNWLCEASRQHLLCLQNLQLVKSSEGDEEGGQLQGLHQV